MRTFFLVQGYSLLILNFSGSTGYGEDFLNSLLGNIGELDVQDCGKLIKLAIEKHSEKVDPSKVAVYGGSHGGFMTGWLIGHPEFKDLFRAAVLWNPVINMSYMYSSTDIPDWILACCLNKDWSYRVTSEDNKVFFDKSPISVVHNVKTPSLILIGGSDKRVPPHQGFQYHHMLKDMSVPTKLYHYPEDGHAIGGTEPGLDATMNIFFWFDQEFNK
jgi:acylaminoacyl-peptidase